jgi:hypothetical protein
MPIKGLTQVRRLPRLGKIKMGIKVKTTLGVEYPQKTDYFVVPPEVADVYGDRPKALDIIIPVEDEDKWAPQYYKLYSKTQGLVCRGDGCSASRLVDTTTGDRARHTTIEAKRKDWLCEGHKCLDYRTGDGCKEVMSLQFILYKVPGMGIWQINTSSINSIININSCADYIRAMFGKISWIPLQLTVEPKAVQNPESGKRQTVYVLNLRNNMTLLGMVESTKKFQAQLPISSCLSLPPADDVPIENEELAIDGDEPSQQETAEIETLQVHQEPGDHEPETESDIFFDKLESDSPPASKVDVQRVISTINSLRQKGNKTVTQHALATRFADIYHIEEPLEGMSMKQALSLLSPEQAADFCNWLNQEDRKTPLG